MLTVSVSQKEEAEELQGEELEKARQDYLGSYNTFMTHKASLKFFFLKL